jgi:hypothetical protein
VSLSNLRKLADYFPEKDSLYQLDPSYEFTEPTADENHVAIFQMFQKFRAARLLEPVGEEHLYFAAKNSKQCQLTGLGHHYWLLAKQERI